MRRNPSIFALRRRPREEAEMPTRLESARKGILTDPMIRVAEQERVDPESLRRGISEGKIILLGDSRRESVPPEGETRMNHRLIRPVGFRTDS